MIDLNAVNDEYELMMPEDRLIRIFQTYDPRDILVTSSFGGTSAVLLHMISKVQPGHPIHFIDTSFHFEETLRYKELLTSRLHLNVINVRAKGNKNRFTHENETWRYNQDLCCFINKVDPLDQIKGGYKIWISGLMAYQNANRKHIRIFEHKESLIKFHPMIDMTSSDVALYQLIHELPAHKLTARGYDSIGCKHCTQKGHGRSGRWAGTSKTECGLHI